MSDDITPTEILRLINERDAHTQDKLIDILETQKETAKTLEKVCTHIIVSEEDKRHDADFKKEVRTHIKFAEPILYKAKDNQEARAKILIIISAVFVTGILGAFFKFG